MGFAIVFSDSTKLPHSIIEACTLLAVVILAVFSLGASLISFVSINNLVIRKGTAIVNIGNGTLAGAARTIEEAQLQQSAQRTSQTAYISFILFGLSSLCIIGYDFDRTFSVIGSTSSPPATNDGANIQRTLADLLTAQTRFEILLAKLSEDSHSETAAITASLDKIQTTILSQKPDPVVQVEQTTIRFEEDVTRL